MDIEDLLFKQVNKPSYYLMTRAINIFDDRYRINVYCEKTEDSLVKRKICSSYYARYSDGNLNIIREEISQPRKN